MNTTSQNFHVIALWTPNNSTVRSVVGTCLFSVHEDSAIIVQIKKSFKEEFANLKGVGSSILDFVIERLWTTNISEIRVTTDDDNKLALRVYAKKNFRPDPGLQERARKGEKCKGEKCFTLTRHEGQPFKTPQRKNEKKRKRKN